MQIIVGKTAGPCFGVKNAVDKAKEELGKSEKLYCLGELVHNEEVTKELEQNGMIFVDKIEDATGKVIIRAHGEPESTYKKAKNLGIEIIDLTCPKVAKIHKIAREYTLNKYYIFITGKDNHPEVVGITGFCSNNYFVIEDELNVEKAIERYKASKYKKLLLISQTTFSLEKFENIAKIIKTKIPEVEIINTICTATKLRQEETYEISKGVDAMIIIGGKHSSNTNKLHEIASKNCPTIFIERAEELNEKEIENCETIGVMAGASTPEKSIQKVIEILEKI